MRSRAVSRGTRAAKPPRGEGDTTRLYSSCPGREKGPATKGSGPGLRSAVLPLVGELGFLCLRERPLSEPRVRPRSAQRDFQGDPR